MLAVGVSIVEINAEKGLHVVVKGRTVAANAGIDMLRVPLFLN